MAKEMGTIKIEGTEFTLFYDYDQLRDQKLTELSEDGKIKWFGFRMEMVFLEPLRKIFNRQSVAHKELNSSPESDWPRAAFMTDAFSILLNGIEALGSFITSEDSSKKNNFITYVKTYMKDWDINVPEANYETKWLPNILWKHFRNGIAHGFCVEGGGIEYHKGNERWSIRKWTEGSKGRLEIDPVKFFKDFRTSVKSFFNDIKSKQRSSFLTRFQNIYPH